MHPVIEKIEKKYYRKSKIPKFDPGDTIRVSLKVKEGDKERLQAFEGVVIAKRGSGLNETFTVRRVSFGIGVERIFLLHSPVIQSMRVVRKGKVRRAKLFYLRGRAGKKARVQELIIDESKAISVSAPESESPEKTESTKSAIPV